MLITRVLRLADKNRDNTFKYLKKNICFIKSRQFSGINMSGASTDLLNFINASPTPFHLVQQTESRLESAGFSKEQLCIYGSVLFLNFFPADSSLLLKIKFHTNHNLTT